MYIHTYIHTYILHSALSICICISMYVYHTYTHSPVLVMKSSHAIQQTPKGLHTIYIEGNIATIMMMDIA